MLEIWNLTVGFGDTSKSNWKKVGVSAVRWPLMEIDCTGLDKIIKNSNKNSTFEKIKIDFYQNELVLN